MTIALPTNSAGQEPTALVFIDGQPTHFYYYRPFSDPEDYRRMLAEDGISFERSFAVHAIWRKSDGAYATAPLCGHVRA